MAVLGIELGSTRIKAVLIEGSGRQLASGTWDWENKWEGGYWTYDLGEVWKGLAGAYADLKKNLAVPAQIEAIGISAMMHGYLAFDREGKLLAPFRTWRNTTTARAAEELTALFGFNIPQRWSIAHLGQAILDGEPHVKEIAFLTTLAGYVHWRLTGEKVLGVGDASGMFPLSEGKYNAGMLAKFDAAYNPGFALESVLPKILSAGDGAGCLSAEGAKLLDPAGELPAGIPLCPPEGDAGTGMAATNAVRQRTGNISAGTSVFAMIVLEKPLSKVHPEIDLVTTPDGADVAMVHCNNCTADIDAWAAVFSELLEAAEKPCDKNIVYGILYEKALQGAPDAGGLLSYNYLSGEPVTGFIAGRPLLVRKPESVFTLSNFCRNLIWSAVATLKIGMDILSAEGVKVEKLLGHGGLFKAGNTGQKLMAAALGTPVAVMESAGEGGAWGIALLALYMLNRGESSLADWLEQTIFSRNKSAVAEPGEADARGFAKWLETYKSGLAIEEAAVKVF